MTFVRKILSDKLNLLILFLFIAGLFIRQYNFPERLIFGPEQGISFLTSAGNLTKFSLLGETNLQRATTDNHIPFHGASYSYLILPFLVLFNFRVLPITVLFMFFNLFTAWVFYLVVKKIFGKPLAVLSLFFFLFSAVMIHHSLFAWILNPLPLLGTITLYCLYLIFKNNQKISPIFWLGFMSGLGFGLQNLYLPFGVFIFFAILLISNKKLLATLVYPLGAIIGNLPMVLFDLRHDFYHVQTMWQYFIDVSSHRISGFTDYYHFLYLFPFLFIFYAIISLIFYRIYKPLIYIPLIVFLYFNLSSPLVNLNSSTGMPPGVTLSSLEKASALIAKDTPPEKFNVATLWDFDTRAHPLRYLLRYYYSLTPQPVEEYKNIDALYVFSPSGYDLDNPQVWELQSFYPYEKIDLKINIPGYSLYKLTKLPN